MENFINSIIFVLGIFGSHFELKVRPVSKIKYVSENLYSKDLEMMFEDCLRRNTNCDEFERAFKQLPDPLLFNEKCQGNDRFSCLMSGLIYKKGGDADKGAFYLKLAVDLGIPYAEALGEMISGTQENGCQNESAISFKELCFRGYGLFCKQLSDEYFYTNNVEEALHFLKLASWSGMVNLERDFERLEVAKLVENKKIYQLQDRCLQGSLPSCIQVLKLDLINGNPFNLEVYFKKACELGHEFACRRISYEIKEVSNELSFQLEKCLAGIKSFCHIIKRQAYMKESYSSTIGEQYYETNEVIADEEIMQKLGINYLIDDCHVGNQDSCLNAASLIEGEMSGKSENIRLHESLLQKGCLQKSEDACQKLIGVYRGFAREDRAQEWLKKSCEFGHIYHCREFLH